MRVAAPTPPARGSSIASLVARRAVGDAGEGAAASEQPQRRDRRGGDRGAVVVVVAAGMGAFLVLMALVLDLSGARRDRDADQVAADAMALAAAADLGGSAASAVAACEAAWDYLVVNLPSPVAVPASSPCAATFDGACDNAAPVPRETPPVQLGDFTVTFTHPVPDGHPLMDADHPGSDLDGPPCDRFGVRVRQDRANLWAAGSVELDVDAVGRHVRGIGDVIAPFVLLEEHACSALVLGGNAELHVTNASGGDGYVAIDSDGSECQNPGKVINVVFDVEGNAELTAGVVAMYALAQGNAAFAYTPGLVLDPPPVASSAPVGRNGMDWRYNCNTANACPYGDPAHLDDLIASWGGPGAPPPSEGFTTWSEAGYSCSLNSTTVVPAGNWYIDCPSGLSSSRDITFQGGNIVTEGPIVTGGNGVVRINCSDSNPSDTTAPSTCPADPPSPGILFQRNGDLTRNGNRVLELHETFVYLATGTLDLSGNADVIWTAPDDPSHPFDDLAVWVESDAEVTFTGNSQLFLEGIIFLPNAHLSMSGNTETEAINAQIFARTAELSGNSLLSFAPTEDRTMSVGRGRPLLIR